MYGTQKILSVESRLYNYIVDFGGYGLLAVYCKLKYNRNRQECYTPVKNKSNNKISKNYSLLEKETGINRKTLKKYVPKLISKNLAFFDKKGGFHLLGVKKTNKLINKIKGRRPKKNLKYLPIQVGGKLTDVKTSVKYVMLHSNLCKQKHQYKKKMKLQKSDKKGKTSKAVKQTSISNQGFFELYNKNSRISVNRKRANGYYLKRKMESLELIRTIRQFSVCVDRPMSFNDYLNYKKHNPNKKLTWVGGYACLETSNEVLDYNDYTCKVINLIHSDDNPIAAPKVRLESLKLINLLRNKSQSSVKTNTFNRFLNNIYISNNNRRFKIFRKNIVCGHMYYQVS